MPVNKYVGGVEHASMHLLYARFITKVLRDMGFLSFNEPFPSLFHQGIITGRDGKKMSKRGGAVPPDELINEYGADLLRLYLSFGFSYIEGGPWDENGIKAIARFVLRVGRAVENFMCLKTKKDVGSYQADNELEYVRSRTIKQAGADFESFRFNTAIARIMEFLNAIQSHQKTTARSRAYEEPFVKDLITLLAPVAPHLTEELWEYIGCPYSVHDQTFPIYDETKLACEMNNIVVQVNGRLKEVLSLPSNMGEEEIKAAVAANEKIQTFICGCEIKKIIYIEGRLVNIVCR
jgi:leucyl-tRNA synthetase